MENSSFKENKTFDIKNPWKFCTDLSPRYHRFCAKYQSQIFFGKSDKPGALYSFEFVGKNCALGPSVLLKEMCYQSLGYHVAQSALGKLADILESCRQMPDNYGMEMCISGAAKESVFQQYADFKDVANELCASLTEGVRSICFSEIERMIK